MFFLLPIYLWILFVANVKKKTYSVRIHNVYGCMSQQFVVTMICKKSLSLRNSSFPFFRCENEGEVQHFWSFIWCQGKLVQWQNSNFEFLPKVRCETYHSPKMGKRDADGECYNLSDLPGKIPGSVVDDDADIDSQPSSTSSSGKMTKKVQIAESFEDVDLVRHFFV